MAIRSKLEGIQVLRGVTACLVVLHHYSDVVGHFGTRDSWIVWSGIGYAGAAGVDIFFVISGFIMLYTTSVSRRSDGGWLGSRIFLEKRFFRIFPLYWLWLTVALALHAMHLVERTHKYSVIFYIQSYLLSPTSFATNFQPLLPQGWTLTYELLFYISFALSIAVRVGRWRIPFIAAIFFVLWVAGNRFPLESGTHYLFCNPIIWEFVLGMIAAKATLLLADRPIIKSNRPLGRIMTGVGVLFFIITIIQHTPDTKRLLYWGAPAVLIVVGMAIDSGAQFSKIAVWLGNASYSIYLTHLFGAEILHWAMVRYKGLASLQPDLLILIASFVTVAVTSLTFPTVESPLQRLIKPRQLARH